MKQLWLKTNFWVYPESQKPKRIFFLYHDFNDDPLDSTWVPKYCCTFYYSKEAAILGFRTPPEATCRMSHLSLLYWTRTPGGFMTGEALQPTMPGWLQSALLPQSGFFLICVNGRCSDTHMHVRRVCILFHDWRGRTSIRSPNQENLSLRLAGRALIMVDWDLILISLVKMFTESKVPFLPYFIHALWNLKNKQLLWIPLSECLCVNIRIL